MALKVTTTNRVPAFLAMAVMNATRELEATGGEALVPVTLKNGLRFDLGSQPNVCGVVASVPASGRIANGHAQGREGAGSGISNMSSAALAEVVARESAISP